MSIRCPNCQGYVDEFTESLLDDCGCAGGERSLGLVAGDSGDWLDGDLKAYRCRNCDAAFFVSECRYSDVFDFDGEDEEEEK